MTLMTPAAKTALDRDGWTIDDLYEIPDDGLRYELLDGMLLVSPPAVLGHYYGAFELGVLLKAALSDEWRIACNPEVRWVRGTTGSPSSWCSDVGP